MDALRAVVSGRRNRHKEGRFDLDLTYITPRVIVMGFPSSGLEASYRNSITTVAQFLNTKHPEFYLVFNVAERKFDSAAFNFQVMDQFCFDDKQTASLETTLTLCKVRMNC